MMPCPQQTSFGAFHDHMRMLWEQHAAWTRMTIISIAESLPDVEFVIQRLLRNPADLAALFRPFYGETIANQLQTLITAHLTLAAELVRAAKAGDSAAAADIERRWYANADNIAALLRSINPYWDYQTMRAMWHHHLEQVKAQAVARLNHDYASDIAIYDEGELLLLQMADTLTEGIVRQFPSCFGC